MSHAQRKVERLYIPPRDKSHSASPKASVGNNCKHVDQVTNAFNLGMSRYASAMDKLAKV